MPFPSARSYLGIAKETVRGTALTPSDSIPFHPGTFNVEDKILFLDDKGVRGSMGESYGTVPGPTWSEVGWSGDVFTDTFGFPMASLLADVTTTGAGAPYTHALSPKNSGDAQPTTYTVADYDAIGATSGARYYPSLTGEELTVKFNADGLLEYDYKAKALSSLLVPTAAPPKTFGALLPTAAYVGTVTIGGSQVLTVESGEVSFKRAVTAQHTVDGTSAPYRLFQGPLIVAGKFVFIAEDETELLRFLNNTQPSVALNWLAGAGAATQQLQIVGSKVAYKTGKPIRGKDYVQVDASLEFQMNTTDAGASGGYAPAKVTLQSPKPAGTYA